MAASLASAGTGIGGQVKSMGTVVSGAMGKAKNMVTSPFSTTADNGDPTSLANMPTNLGPEIWITNGQLYETQGKHSKALENYTKALAIEPNSEAALLSIARLHTRQQQYSQAEQFLGRAIAIRPQADTFNELASVQQKQGRTSDSLASLQKAIELDPSNVRFRNNLAGILVADGRSDEAVKQLEQILPPAVANYNVAYLHFSNQNIPAAQQHLQLALQADPNLKEARELMDKLTGSPASQSAIAAYQTANQIYRTAETLAAPMVQANPAVYQPNGITTPPQTAAYPTTAYPTSGYSPTAFPAAPGR